MEYYKQMVKEKWYHFYELGNEINDINWRYYAEELGEIYLIDGISMNEYNKLRLNYDRYNIRKNSTLNFIYMMGKVQSPIIACVGDLEEINKSDYKMEGDEVELFASWCTEMRFSELYKVAILLDAEYAKNGKISAENHQQNIKDEMAKLSGMKPYNDK